MRIHKGLNPNFHYVLAEEGEKGNIVVRNTERNTKKYIGNFFMTSDESILTETDHQFHMNHSMTKSGYTFKVNKPGTAYHVYYFDSGKYIYLVSASYRNSSDEDDIKEMLDGITIKDIK